MGYDKYNYLIGAAILIALAIWAVMSFIRKGSPEPAAPGEIETVTAEEADIPPHIRQALNQAAMRKSAALKSAHVRVIRAFEIDPMKIGLADPKYKAIAVEATFNGYGEYFKLADIDVIDADTDTNFGSDPLVSFFDDQGQKLDEDVIDFSTLPPLRLLLTYVVPDTTQRVRLGYWGQDLDAARPIGPRKR